MKFSLAVVALVASIAPSLGLELEGSLRAAVAEALAKNKGPQATDEQVKFCENTALCGEEAMKNKLGYKARGYNNQKACVNACKKLMPTECGTTSGALAIRKCVNAALYDKKKVSGGTGHTAGIAGNGGNKNKGAKASPGVLVYCTNSALCADTSSTKDGQTVGWKALKYKNQNKCFDACKKAGMRCPDAIGPKQIGQCVKPALISGGGTK